MTGSFSEELLMRLGSIDQKVTDLRDGQPKQDALIASLDKRTEGLERQFADRHAQNTNRLDVLQASVDSLAKRVAGLEPRLVAVETPVVATASRKTTHRKWIMRVVQALAGIATTAAIFVEPASKAVIEFYARRFLDRP